MTTLTDFLLARIAEDEDEARAVSFHPHSIVIAWDANGNWSESTDKLAVQWNPARVIAECEAKRRIVGLHRNWDNDETETATERALAAAHCQVCSSSSPSDWYTDRRDDRPPEWPCLTLHALALPYSDHPDYREEWR